MTRNGEKEMWEQERESFGAVMREKRLALEMTVRKFADEARISAARVTELEANEVEKISDEQIGRICSALKLTGEEKEKLTELAKEAPNVQRQPLDIECEKVQKAVVRIALRRTREKNDAEWDDFVEKLKNSCPKEKEDAGEQIQERNDRCACAKCTERL